MPGRGPLTEVKPGDMVSWPPFPNEMFVEVEGPIVRAGSRWRHIETDISQLRTWFVGPEYHVLLDVANVTLGHALEHPDCPDSHRRDLLGMRAELESFYDAAANPTRGEPHGASEGEGAAREPADGTATADGDTEPSAVVESVALVAGPSGGIPVGGGRPGSELRMWTIYERPKDHPEHFVVRGWTVRPGGETAFPDRDARLAGTLDAARRLIPAGLYRMERSVDDDRCIVETWI